MNKLLLKFLSFLYKCKFYFNIPVTQVSFVTGKIPELMGVLWLLDYFGVGVNKQVIPVLLVVVTVFLVVLGKLWKISGLYDVEQYVNAYKNEVQAKQLRAAEIVIERFGSDGFKK